eukprot:gene9588-6741_t
MSFICNSLGSNSFDFENKSRTLSLQLLQVAALLCIVYTIIFDAIIKLLSWQNYCHSSERQCQGLTILLDYFSPLASKILQFLIRVFRSLVNRPVIRSVRPLGSVAANSAFILFFYFSFFLHTHSFPSFFLMLIGRFKLNLLLFASKQPTLYKSCNSFSLNMFQNGICSVYHKIKLRNSKRKIHRCLKVLLKSIGTIITIVLSHTRIFYSLFILFYLLYLLIYLFIIYYFFYFLLTRMFFIYISSTHTHHYCNTIEKFGLKGLGQPLASEPCLKTMPKAMECPLNGVLRDIFRSEGKGPGRPLGGR